MKSIHIAILATFLNCSSCTGGGKSESEITDQTNTEAVLPSNLIHNIDETDSLIAIAHEKKDALTQHDYKLIIEQCAAINRKVSEKLAKMNFKSDMSDEELQKAMDVLNSDPELPILESQSLNLIQILQQANLDENNRKLYDRMVEEARTTLENI